jgi:hypothetical protein
MVDRGGVRQRPRMNLRRGLFRLWIAASALWAAFWVWHYVSLCSRMSTGDLVCEGTREGRYTILYPFEPTRVGLILIGVPIAVFAVALILTWIFRGFHVARPN